MIVVGGKKYRTLLDNFYVNGDKVMAAYVNGVQVYPEKVVHGTGVTNFRGIYVYGALIQVYAYCVFVDWGDGTSESHLGDYDGTRVSMIGLKHDYEDSEFHLVTLTMITDGVQGSDEGILAFKADEAAQKDTTLADYEFWLGHNPHRPPEEVALLWPVRDKILSDYKNAAIAWEIDGDINTVLIIDYFSRSEWSWSSQSDGSISVSSFSSSVYFNNTLIRYIDGTIYINGRLFVEGHS